MSERKVIHLQLGNDDHRYYGSIEQIFEELDEKTLGFKKYFLKLNLKKKGMLQNDKCTIRMGYIRSKKGNRVSPITKSR